MAESDSDRTTFGLRFPFQIRTAHVLDGLDRPVLRDIDDKRLSLQRAGSEGEYAISIEAFESENTAKDCIPPLWVGLMWAQLNLGLSISAELEPHRVTYAKDPIVAARSIGGSDPVDGLMEGAFPAVYRLGKRLRVAHVPAPSVWLHVDAAEVCRLIEQGVTTPHHGTVYEDEKLRVAIDLYSAHFVERSEEARLLTLVMVLEVLKVAVEKGTAAQALLSAWEQQLKGTMATMNAASADYADLEALGREIVFRREKSIRGQVRHLVLESLVGDAAATELSKKAVRAYDKRSELTHKGTLPAGELRAAYRDAKVVVEAVLRAKFGMA